MEQFTILNSGLMWIMCAIVIAAVAIQTIIFMRKGWKQAKELGIPDDVIKGTVKNSAIFSIVPTIPTIIALIVLLPLLGTPFPWLRLSVIGSGSFETLAATMGISGAGGTFGESLTNQATVSALWVMTVGGTACTIVTLIILRPICTVFDKFQGKNYAFIGVVGICSIAGVIGCLFIQYGTASSNTFIVSMSAFVMAAGLKLLVAKKPKLKKLSEYNLSISLITGMAVAILLG